MATDPAVTKTPLQGTFHRRALPEPAVSFASKEGKEIFAETLQSGYLNGYFHLAEHYSTQGHPSFCGIGSLTMALNALLIDPGRVWQGIWRWFDESMLDCCESLEVVKKKGITLPKLACLAHCNGAEVELKHGSNVSLEEFRQDLERISREQEKHTVMIASYSRKTFGQTGTGHFSPIAAYNPIKDMALIMDVARFKYPPHWVPVALLHQSLQTIDEDTGKSRGYMLLSASERMYSECFCLAIKEEIDKESPDKVAEKIEHLLSLAPEGEHRHLLDEATSSSSSNCGHCCQGKSE